MGIVLLGVCMWVNENGGVNYMSKNRVSICVKKRQLGFFFKGMGFCPCSLFSCLSPLFKNEKRIG